MKKNNYISLVQVIAALLIVNYHTSKLEIPILQLFAKFGFILNTIFVFLSGFLLTKSILIKPSNDFYSFMKRRVSRIYPSYIVSILMILFIYL